MPSIMRYNRIIGYQKSANRFWAERKIVGGPPSARSTRTFRQSWDAFWGRWRVAVLSTTASVASKRDSCSHFPFPAKDMVSRVKTLQKLRVVVTVPSIRPFSTSIGKSKSAVCRHCLTSKTSAHPVCIHTTCFSGHLFLEFRHQPVTIKQAVGGLRACGQRSAWLAVAMCIYLCLGSEPLFQRFG